MNENEKNKKTTIYDIATRVGTSAATVSRVLSNSGYPVNDVLKQRILETAEQMNYVPNIVGRMLKKSDSRDIGVIVPNISNPFYPTLVLGIEQEAKYRGYDILLFNSFRDPDTESKYLQTLYQKQVKGIIISPIAENIKRLRELQKMGLKITVLDQAVKDIKCSRVGFDYIKGGMMAIDHLVEMGHTNIAFVTSPLTKESRIQTYEGYKIGLYRNGIEFCEENVIVSRTEEEYEKGTYEFENGKMLVESVASLAKRPTAVFAVNDMTAFGLVHGFLDNGLKVPEDISVVGFDNIEMSSMINPPLTTVDQPSFDTGRLACKLLLDSMEENWHEDFSITLEPALVVRKSVRKLAGN